MHVPMVNTEQQDKHMGNMVCRALLIGLDAHFLALCLAHL